MTDITTVWTAVYVAMLAAFTGYVVISRVPLDIVRHAADERLELHPRDRRGRGDGRLAARDHPHRASDRFRRGHPRSGARDGRRTW